MRLCGVRVGKYLIGRDGKVVGSYSSTVTPQSSQLVRAIQAQL